MSVLVHLLENPGEVCSRQQLLDAVWDGQFVGEEALTRCIWDLRRALGDDSRKPRFIETVPKVGYRLVGSPLALVEEPAEQGAQKGAARWEVGIEAVGRRRDLLVLAGKVERFWIRSFLEAALPAEPLELVKREAPEAVEGPWEGLAEASQPAGAALPLDQPLWAIFEASGRALLLLGEPGAGKSTELLRLAATALGRARADPSEPVPVVLHLSSWQPQAGSLDGWLISEINRRYQVPTAVGREWLERRELLLFLDGLDEMPRARRPLFIEACNELRQTNGLVGLVLTCRSSEYEEACKSASKLRLGGALTIEPLTRTQIFQYLTRAEGDMQALQAALLEEPELERLAESPLMLSILGRAYVRGAPTIETARALEPRRRRLWGAYVDTLLSRPGPKPPCSRIEIRARLAWLANALRRFDETIFRVDSLQPSWLSRPLDLGVYLLLSRVAVGTLLGLLHGLLARTLGYGWQVAAVLGAAGLASGGLVAAIDGVRAWQPLAQQGFVRAAFPWLVFLSTGLLSAVFASQLSTHLHGIRAFFLLGMSFGLLFGVNGMRRPIANDVAMAEAVRWSWPQAKRGFLFGALGGLVPQLIWWGGARLWSEHAGLALSAVGLEPAISLGMVGAVLFGLSGRRVEEEDRGGPGLYLRNAAFGGALAAGAVWLALGLLEHAPRLSPGPDLGSFAERRMALPWLAGTLAVFWFGGLDVIKHLSVRGIIHARRLAPWRFRHFLDFAVSRALLRSVGSGYAFIHRELLDFLASESEMVGQKVD